MNAVPRRLSDKIAAAHAQACEEGRLEVAELLLEALELDFSASGGKMIDHREKVDEIAKIYERHEALTGSSKPLK
ncbi:MAG: hypothetical protein A2516_09965 [Alphaproteobacteria bacterium RIFOXYD12_FULL_60_8]|nr:MAG: hypothetical protein A2516_09965 [Alphaproteobacteria bacterium RIFOXYD12_FULL_60_8]